MASTAVTFLFLVCFFEYKRIKSTGRETEKLNIQWGTKLPQRVGMWWHLPTLSTWTWSTVGLKKKKHFGMVRALSHWLTLSRIIDNHHWSRRAAHGCCGVPKWGEGRGSGFLGTTSARWCLQMCKVIFNVCTGEDNVIVIHACAERGNEMGYTL